jgi:hypothetical protein
MAGDDGAREIRALLETSDDELQTHLQTLSEPLPEDDPAAGTTDWTTFDALRNVRRFYQRLARRVRAIRTSSRAKGDVLDALRNLDAGLKLFAKGLREADDDPRVAEGAQQVQAAAAALAQASKALV